MAAIPPTSIYGQLDADDNIFGFFFDPTLLAGAGDSAIPESSALYTLIAPGGVPNMFSFVVAMPSFGVRFREAFRMVRKCSGTETR